jgi:hypothetical protein
MTHKAGERLIRYSGDFVIVPVFVVVVGGGDDYYYYYYYWPCSC